MSLNDAQERDARSEEGVSRTIDSIIDAGETGSGTMTIKCDPQPVLTPQMAPAQTFWTRGVRTIVAVVIVVVLFGYVAFGTILARNVTYNISQNIDPGAANGIRRFSRQRIIDVWQTMWDKAPDFGTIDLTRVILLGSAVVFFVAFASILLLVVVPSRREWAAGFGVDQESDTISGD